MSRLATALTAERRYLEIQPADEAVSPGRVSSAISELHRLRQGGPGAESVPTYEILLAATGRADDTGQRSLSWFVGVDDGDLESVRLAMTQCLEHADVTTTTQSYACLLQLPIHASADAATIPHAARDGGTTTSSDATSEELSQRPDTDAAIETDAAIDAAGDRNPIEPATDTDSGPDDHAESEPDTASASVVSRVVSAVGDWYAPPPQPDAEPPLVDYDVAGVEFYGVGRRPSDWQCPLPSIDAFAGEDGTAGAWPLARLCDRLAVGDAPALVQLLVRPKRDYTAVVDHRYSQVAAGEDLWRHWAGKAFTNFLLGDDGTPTSPDQQSRSQTHSQRQTRTQTRTQAGRHTQTRATGRSSAQYRRDDPSASTTGRRETATPERRPHRGSSASHPPTETSLPASEQRRLEALASVDGSQSFTVNARAIAFGTEDDPDVAAETLRPLTGALDALENSYYRVHGAFSAYGSMAANDLLGSLLERAFTASPTRRRHKLPLVPNRSPAIVMAPEALAGLMVTDAPALSSDAHRALATTPRERTGIELPPGSVLAPYLETDGMAIGQPRTVDREPLDATVSIPPAVQPLHTGVFGASGGGKSVLGQRMVFANHDATGGADILLDSKGDGGPAAYLQTHFAAHRDLEAIYHFDCSELLPALPVLSIAPQLDAGINRLQAIENVVQGHLELLAGYMGEEEFNSAKTAVNVIEMLLKAQFDPVHGGDTTSQYELLEALGHMHHTGDPPAVSDPELQARLAEVTAHSDDVFDSVMAAAADRITNATADGRLRPLFAHTADDASDAWFDLCEHLDENCVIILDISGYRENAQRLLTLLFVAELWTALQRRATLARTDTDSDADEDADEDHEDTGALRGVTEPGEPGVADAERGPELPTVNLYLEEAADVATSDVLAELLRKGRSFGVGVTVMMQFPQQVRDSHPRVYHELINDIGTHITGPVNDPGDLATPFATDAIPHDAMADRIGELSRGEWLVRPAAEFDTERPTPFICESLPLPAGHPDGDAPLTGSAEETYQAHRTLLDTRMFGNYGLAVPETTAAAAQQPRHPDTQADASDHATPGTAPTAATAGGAGATTNTSADAVGSGGDGDAIANPILHTDRFPGCVTHLDAPPYPLVCEACETRFPATSDGMHNAMACCHDSASIDRDDVPICSLDLALTPREIHDSDYSPAQLRLLAAVYMGHQQRFDPALEYDIVTDSMIRLREYVGADSDDVAELRDDGLLTRDCTKPHYLYTVTPAGRAELHVGHREGIAHGDGKGDLSESSLHVTMAETLARYVHQASVAPPDSPAVRVKRYHEVGDGRLDVAALDADGDLVVAGEAELINNDRQRAIPEDFDKMAACDSDDAIWIVKNRTAAKTVLDALNDPLEGEARVPTAGSRNMAPQKYSIDTAGLTDIYTFQHVRDTLLDDPRPTHDL